MTAETQDIADAKGFVTLHMRHSMLRAQIVRRKRKRGEPDEPTYKVRRRRAGRIRLLRALERIELRCELEDMARAGLIFAHPDGTFRARLLDERLAHVADALWTLTAGERWVSALEVAVETRGAVGGYFDGTRSSWPLRQLAEMGIAERAGGSGKTMIYRSVPQSFSGSGGS